MKEKKVTKYYRARYELPDIHTVEARVFIESDNESADKYARDHTNPSERYLGLEEFDTLMEALDAE